MFNLFKWRNTGLSVLCRRFVALSRRFSLSFCLFCVSFCRLRLPIRRNNDPDGTPYAFYIDVLYEPSKAGFCLSGKIILTLYYVVITFPYYCFNVSFTFILLLDTVCICVSLNMYIL
jgi:hypothetical protein